MTIEVISTILGVVGISNVITFFLTKRKYNSEVDSQQIHNMDASFDTYRKIMEEALSSQKKRLEVIIEGQDKKIDYLQKENNSLRAQVSQLQMQMLNILGSICLDSTCKLRKMNFQSDVKFSDNGVSIGPHKETE